MAGRYKSDLTRDDVTPKAMWINRRRLLAGLAAGSVASPALASLGARKTGYGKDLELNTYEEITSYNNFYEFGTGKDDPARNAGEMKTSPWSVVIDGLVDRPGTYSMDDILAGQQPHRKPAQTDHVVFAQRFHYRLAGCGARRLAIHQPATRNPF